MTTRQAGKANMALALRDFRAKLLTMTSGKALAWLYQLAWVRGYKAGMEDAQRAIRGRIA